MVNIATLFLHLHNNIYRKFQITTETNNLRHLAITSLKLDIVQPLRDIQKEFTGENISVTRNYRNIHRIVPRNHHRHDIAIIKLCQERIRNNVKFHTPECKNFKRILHNSR